MTDKMIYILIYGVCIIAMLAVLIFNNSKLKVWQKILAVLFAPAMIVLLVIGVLVLFIDHVCKHGFHNIIPRSKSKAYPLDKDDFRFWSKDTIAAGTDKMSIVEYNKKYSPKLRLRFSMLNMKKDDTFVNMPLFMADRAKELIERLTCQ